MAADRLRFGVFAFDLTRRELWRNGDLVRLQPQPAQVLARLLEKPGRVVSRDELRQAVWSNDTFVDFDRGLNFCIAQLRSALHDNASQPVYVRTVPKQGYQFIAPVTPADEAAVQNTAPATARRVAWLRVALILALIAGAALAIGVWLRPRFAFPPTIVAVLRFDNETGDPAATPLADALTDRVVEQLTAQSGGRYDVIGNARILWQPREQRDLSAIAASLHARYVVLGQVQRAGDHTRVLAHLIRLPEQTHVWVKRIEPAALSSAGDDGDAAQKIGADLARRLLAADRPLPNIAR